MKFKFLFPFLALTIVACTSHSDMDKLIDDNLQLAIQQYKYMSALLPPDRLPVTYTDSTLKTSGTGWWCSGFYPGSLWYLYEYSNDEALKTEAIRSTGLLEKEQYNTSTHDLGFMLFCSYGNGYRLTQNPAYKDIILTGSESLCSRYRPATGCIRSWNFGSWQFPVIIDNMMNLEMLMWAGRVSGNNKYHDIAVSHADKTIENHPHLPADKIPYWDYDAPDIPEAKRDVSSATIMASALIELSQYTKGEQSKNYLNTAQTILKNLSTPVYRAEAGTNGGFILKHSVGALPFNSEVDVPLTYADYYFIEALMRLRNLNFNREIILSWNAGIF